MAVLTITKDNFKTEVVESDKPVLLDFWASWCAPCMMQSPIVDELAEEHPELKVGKVNVDEQPQLAAAFGVESIPTLVIIKDGITKEEFARSKQQLKGNYLLGLESTASRSSSLGRGELRGRIYTDEELIRRIEGVTMESVQDIIPRVLDTERMAGAFVGRVNKRETEVKRIFETA